MNAPPSRLNPETPAGSLLWPDAPVATRLVRRLAVLYAAAVLGLLGLASWPPAGFRASLVAGIAIGALLLPLAGLLATWPIAAARVAAQAMPGPAEAPRHRVHHWLRRLPVPRARMDAAARLAWLARRPQGVIVPLLCGLSVVVLWLLPPSAGGVAAGGIPLGIAAIVLTFPLLVAERVMAATPQSRLPEAAGLQALLFVPVIVIPLAGVAELAGALHVAAAAPATMLLRGFLVLVAAELALRALANWFLPPPQPAAARAAVGSVSALLLQPRRLAPDGLAAPIRDHLGLDFSRSWALRFARGAAVPIALVMALLGWALTGVSLIDLDRRGVYERLGAPVAVWAPGLHVGLPWPLGRVRLVDFGIIHALPLGGDSATQPPVAAEAAPPPAVDRLWDSPHPAEVSYIIASRETSGGQSFQTVSLDLRVLFRVGMDDAAAMRAAYAVAEPEALVRSEAGRLLARDFAGTVLEDALAADRGSLADALRGKLQAALDRLDSGVEVVGVVIEAIHPPAGAAAAYHNVQAAEIIANTEIATERGRALATAAMARQEATSLVSIAQGGAADIVANAKVAQRGFTADREAARAGGAAFLLERYLANLTQALARSPLVIVDHRLGGTDAPVIDLRSFAAPGSAPTPDD